MHSRATSGKAAVKKTEEEAAQTDVAAAVLSLLSERGPCSIGDVLTATRAGVSPLLSALQDLEEFRLVEYSPEDNRVSLTGSGAPAATAVAANGIRAAASRLLDAPGAPRTPAPTRDGPAMRVPRRLIERRLSSALGADVTIGHVTASVGAGTVDAFDVAVRDPIDDPVREDPGVEPALRVPRLRAFVSLAGALSKRLAIPSVAIERPSLSVIQDATGAVRLPAWRTDRSNGNTRKATAGHDGWAVELGRVLVVDGDIRFASSWPPLAGPGLSFSGVLANVARAGDGYDFTVIMRLASVGGRAVSGPEVEALGHVASGDNGIEIDTALSLSLGVGTFLEVRARQGPLPSAMEVELRGLIQLETLSPLLPALGGAIGCVRCEADLARAPDGSWTLSRLELRGADVRLAPLVARMG